MVDWKSISESVLNDFKRLKINERFRALMSQDSRLPKLIYINPDITDRSIQQI